MMKQYNTICLSVLFLSLLVFVKSQDCELADCQTCQAKNTKSCAICNSISIKTVANDGTSYCDSSLHISPVGIVFAALLFLVFMFICIRAIYYITQCCQGQVHSGNAIGNQQVINPSQQNLQNFMNQANVDYFDPNIKWNFATDQNNQHVTDICCICLNEQVNLSTACGHMFHDDCLIEWLTKKGICPLCHRASLNPVKFYCMKCQQSWFQSDIRFLKMIQGEVGKQCPNCQASNKERRMSEEQLK